MGRYLSHSRTCVNVSPTANELAKRLPPLKRRESALPMSKPRVGRIAQRAVEGVVDFRDVLPPPAVFLLNVGDELIEIAGQRRTADARAVEQLERIRAIVDRQLIDVADCRPVRSRELLD